MKRRVIALVLLIALGSIEAADACRTTRCCLGIYERQVDACYQTYLASVLPNCLAAVIACGCTLAPVVGAGCAVGCAAATASCIASLITAGSVYNQCLSAARWQRDTCLDSIVADCV